jgi:hypothetical protein
MYAYGVVPRAVLLTIEPGATVASRFGHTAIWIYDPASRVNAAYNLAGSNSREALRGAVRGAVIGRVSRTSVQTMLERYRQQDRSVWAQELNLSALQIRALTGHLERQLWERPLFPYEYFSDNCTTNVRDVIDAVLGGQVSSSLGDAYDGGTLRSRLLAASGDGTLLRYLLLFGLGRQADQPITAWEAMFLPVALQEGLRSITYESEGGETVSLVLHEHALYEASSAPRPARAPYPLLAAGFAGMMILLTLRSTTRSGGRGSVFVAAAATWYLLSGLLGSLLVWMWVTGSLPLSGSNENILQANPVGLALAILLGKGLHLDRPGMIAVRSLAGLLLLTSTVGVVLGMSPAGAQANGGIVATFATLHMTFALGVWLLGFGPAGRTPLPLRDEAVLPTPDPHAGGDR